MTGPIRTILAAVDFSASSERAFDYALAVARRTGATLHVLHAWRALPWSPPVGLPPIDQTAPVESALDSLRRSAERELGALRGRAERDGVACRTHLEIGVASATIAQVVTDLGADLVLVGARGRSALSHVLLGSAAERVMRILACPVLVVPERAQVPPRLPLRKVVVAVDFSPPARRALALALRLGEALGRPEIVLLYFVPLVLLAIFFHLQYRNLLRDGRQAHLEVIAEHQANTFDLFLRERLVNLDNIIDDPL